MKKLKCRVPSSYTDFNAHFGLLLKRFDLCCVDAWLIECETSGGNVDLVKFAQMPQLRGKTGGNDCKNGKVVRIAVQNKFIKDELLASLEHRIRFIEKRS